MNHDSEDFEQLRRLMALKRHEQPPPGYFHDFSREVCARIKAGERATGSNFLGRFFPDLYRFWGSLETKPILAGAVGVAACAFLLGGVVYSTETADTDSQAFMAPPAVEASLGLAGTHPSRGSVFEPPTLAGFQSSNSFGNLASQGSLFPVQQVNFTR